VGVSVGVGVGVSVVVGVGVSVGVGVGVSVVVGVGVSVGVGVGVSVVVGVGVSVVGVGVSVVVGVGVGVGVGRGIRVDVDGDVADDGRSTDTFSTTGDSSSSVIQLSISKSKAKRLNCARAGEPRKGKERTVRQHDEGCKELRVQAERIWTSGASCRNDHVATEHEKTLSWIQKKRYLLLKRRRSIKT